MFSLLQVLVPLLQIDQRCEIANALSPVADFIGGNILGLTPMVALVLSLGLAFALLVLAATRSAGFALKALGVVILAAVLITVVPELIGAVGPDSC